MLIYDGSINKNLPLYPLSLSIYMYGVDACGCGWIQFICPLIWVVILEFGFWYACFMVSIFVLFLISVVEFVS